MPDTNLNLSLGIPKDLVDEASLAANSKGAASKALRRRSGPTTLAKVIRYIQSKNFPSGKEAELIQKARACPTGALVHFCENIS